MLTIPADIAHNTVLLLAAIASTLVALVSTRALPDDIRQGMKASIRWMDAATLAVASVVYVWALSRTGQCEMTSLLLSTAIAGAIGAVVSFAVHMASRNGALDNGLVIAAVLGAFFFLRVSVVVSLIFSVAYFSTTKAAEDLYQAYGINLSLEQNGVLVRAPEFLRVMSSQPLTFVGETRECKSTSVQWTHIPEVGRLTTGTQGAAVYTAPSSIEQVQAVELVATSPSHGDKKRITLQLFPTPGTIERHSVPDPHHSDALYDFFVLSKTETWLYGNTLEVASARERGNSGVDACAIVKELGTSRILDNYQAVIAVGTASREGTDSAEKERAGLRATKLATCIHSTLSSRSKAPMPAIYTLNLGRFQSEKTSDATGEERRAILIGVVTGHRTEAVALSNFTIGEIAKWQNSPFFTYLARNYLAGGLIRWVPK